MKVAIEGWFWHGEGFPCLDRRRLPEGYHLSVRTFELERVKRVEIMPRKLAGGFVGGVSVYGFVDTENCKAPFFILTEKVEGLEKLLETLASPVVKL